MNKHWYGTYSVKALAVAAIVTAVYYIFLSHLDFFQTRILHSQDSIAEKVYKQESAGQLSEHIVLIPIDNIDFKKVRKWPWPRSLFGEFLNKLNSYNPKVVFFDIIFHGPSPSGPSDDRLLANEIREGGNTILASYFDNDWNYQIPYEKFTEAAADIGFVNKPRDLDLVVRRSRALVATAKGEVIDLGAELKIVTRYLDIPPDELYLHPDFENPNSVELRRSDTESIFIPIDDRGTFPIDFRIAKHNLKTFHFWEMMQKDLPREELEGKIVLISITSEAFHDQFETPIHEDQPGVVIGANVIEMFLKNKFLKQISPKVTLSVVFLMVFAVCLATLRFSTMISFCVTAVLCAGCWSGAYFLRMKGIQSDHFSPVFLNIFVFAGISTYNYFRLMIRNSRLRQLAITDGLTGMYIYRYLVIRLKSEMERAKRYNLELSFFIADIDHFKSFNDTYGHDIGNEVLKNFSRIIKENVRKTDFVARYGGEEFCAIFPHTSQEKAVQLADKLRQAIESYEFPGPDNKPLKVTASFGVSCFKEGEIETVKKLFTSADAALYRAKETGRNRVCGFDSQTDKVPEEEGEIEGADFQVPLD